MKFKWSSVDTLPGAIFISAGMGKQREREENIILKSNIHFRIRNIKFGVFDMFNKFMLLVERERAELDAYERARSMQFV